MWAPMGWTSLMTLLMILPQSRMMYYKYEQGEKRAEMPEPSAPNATAQRKQQLVHASSLRPK